MRVWPLGPVSRSRSMRVAPEVVPGGAGERPAYRCCMRASRPCPQGPPQARLSRTWTSIQALRAAQGGTAAVEHVVQRGPLALAEPAHHLLLDRGDVGGVLLQERPALVREADQQP